MLEATAIIVNFHTEEHVVELLEHLKTLPEDFPSQIIILDNSPERGLAAKEFVNQEYMEYLPSEKNLGFAAAVNRGLQVAQNRIVILLNPDARPEPGCLSGLIRTLDSTAGAAIAGPRLMPFHAGEPEQPSATLMEPTLWILLLEYTAINRLFPNSNEWLKQHYFVSPDCVSGTQECAMVQGACFAFFRHWIEHVGGFDSDQFFLYWEETDFCKRVRARGGRVLYCPQYQCRHLGGASLTDRAQASRYFWESFHAYMRKHHGRMSATLVRSLLVFGMGMEYLILRTLSFFRSGSDRRLSSDTEAMRLRLRQQL